MLRFGSSPYLECSSKGDSRFSAFYARIKSKGNKSIEELYQASKKFPGGLTGLTWREAKGKVAINQSEVRRVYRELWIEYFNENPNLTDVILQYKGFSDIYGQKGHACQAEEIYSIYLTARDNQESQI
jgi:hypothetical protein